MIDLNQILIRCNSVKIKHYNRYCCYTLLWCVIIMCYKIKKLDDKTIDRSRCETIIEHLPKLIEKPKPDFDFWLEERLCIYEGRFIYFRKKEVDQDFDDFTKYLLFKGLEPFEVSEDFFNKLKEQWKKEGCGYYIVD